MSLANTTCTVSENVIKITENSKNNSLKSEILLGDFQSPENGLILYIMNQIA